MTQARRYILICTALIAATVAVGPACADDRADWKAQVSEAKARAAEARQKAILELQRRKSEPQLAEPWEAELGRRNSKAVLSDSSLRYGDVVSTSTGLFIFVGRGDSQPKASDFVPYGRRSR